MSCVVSQITSHIVADEASAKAIVRLLQVAPDTYTTLPFVIATPVLFKALR